jgi:hypothetical protein
LQHAGAAAFQLSNMGAPTSCTNTTRLLVLLTF